MTIVFVESFVAKFPPTEDIFDDVENIFHLASHAGLLCLYYQALSCTNLYLLLGQRLLCTFRSVSCLPSATRTQRQAGVSHPAIGIKNRPKWSIFFPLWPCEDIRILQICPFFFYFYLIFKAFQSIMFCLSWDAGESVRFASVRSRVRSPSSPPRRSKLYIACSDFFAKVRARSCRCSSFPNRTRCAGLRFGFGCSPESSGIYTVAMLQRS